MSISRGRQATSVQLLDPPVSTRATDQFLNFFLPNRENYDEEERRKNCTRMCTRPFFFVDDNCSKRAISGKFIDFMLIRKSSSQDNYFFVLSRYN